MEQQYQYLYDHAKIIIKTDATMPFYNEKEKVYLEIDVEGVGLKANFMQVMDGM